MPKGKEPSVVMYATSSKSVLYNSPEKSPSNPARILNSVVFPEPFSPNIPATPLNGSENDAPFSTLGKFVNADERGIAEKRKEYLRARMGEFRTELKGCGVDEEEFMKLAKEVSK